MKAIKDYLFEKKISKLSDTCLQLFRQGDFAKSSEVCKELLQLQERRYGTSSTAVLSTINRLSELMIAAGHNSDAKRYLERQLKIALVHKEWIHVDKSLFKLYMLAKDEGDDEGAKKMAVTRIRYADQSGREELISIAAQLMPEIN